MREFYQGFVPEQATMSPLDKTGRVISLEAL